MTKTEDRGRGARAVRAKSHNASEFFSEKHRLSSIKRRLRALLPTPNSRRTAVKPGPQLGTVMTGGEQDAWNRTPADRSTDKQKSHSRHEAASSAPTRPSQRRRLLPESIFSDFNGFRRHSQVTVYAPVLNAKPWSRVGRGANGVSGFLKNNTRPRSAWQEIVVFFKRPGHQLGSFRHSLRTRRGELDLPGTIPQNPERHNKLFLISIL